jgi:hypothetical protein
MPQQPELLTLTTHVEWCIPTFLMLNPEHKLPARSTHVEVMGMEDDGLVDGQEGELT